MAAQRAYPERMLAIHTMPGHLIRRLNQISTSVFAERMRVAGLDMTSPQFAALSALQGRPGIDQATLAGLIAYDRATIGGVVDRLIAKGLVTRARNPDDGRAKILTLTPEGLALLARMTPLVEALQDAILPGLTPEEKTCFIALAAKVATAGHAPQA